MIHYYISINISYTSTIAHINTPNAYYVCKFFSEMTDSNLDFVVWSGCTGLLMIFGLLGNALTLWAIGHATRGKKYEFSGIRWLTTTIFVLNLAFVDTVYCLFFLAYMFYGLQSSPNYNRSEDGSSGVCEFFVLGFQHLALIDGWSIALIAVTRAFPCIK